MLYNQNQFKKQSFKSYKKNTSFMQKIFWAFSSHSFFKILNFDNSQ